MLADPRHVVRHATALRASLDVTALSIVVHGPTNLQLGSALHNRACEGLLEYAHQIGATHVVYHALDFPRRGARVRRGGARAAAAGPLGRGAGRDRLPREPVPGLPGPLQRLPRPAGGARARAPARQPRLGCCSTSGTRTSSPASWASRPRRWSSRCSTRCASSTCTTTSARACAGGEARVDPLQLDLHLPPGGGTCRGTASRPRCCATTRR